MFATNRAGTTQKQHEHVTALWARMRQDAHSGGAAWLCACVEAWVETPTECAETEAVFASPLLQETP
jgi:hypothetical protein